jgi:hypothetical protein
LRKRNPVPTCDIGVIDGFVKKPKPDVDFTNRHPAFGASSNGQSWIRALRTPP